LLDTLKFLSSATWRISAIKAVSRCPALPNQQFKQGTMWGRQSNGGSEVK